VFYYIIKVAYIFFCFENTQGSNTSNFINTVRFKQLQFYNWNVTLLNVHNMCLCWERLENWKTFKQHLCLCLRKVGDLIKIQATYVPLPEKGWRPDKDSSNICCWENLETSRGSNSKNRNFTHLCWRPTYCASVAEKGQRIFL